jgi:hypothetical protein
MHRVFQYCKCDVRFLALLCYAVVSGACGSPKPTIATDTPTTCASGPARVSQPLNYVLRWEAPGWSAVVTVNGLPALNARGGGGERPASVMVRDGENIVRIVTDRQDWAAAPLVIQLCAYDSPDSAHPASTPVAVTLEPSRCDHYEREFTFDAHVPIRWTWQDADAVGEISESDRTAILAQVNGVYNAIRSHDWARYGELHSAILGDAARFLGKTRDAILKDEVGRLALTCKGEPAVTEMRAEKEIRFEIYERAVRVAGIEGAGGHWVIRIRCPETAERSIVINELVFVRIGHAWQLAD